MKTITENYSMWEDYAKDLKEQYNQYYIDLYEIDKYDDEGRCECCGMSYAVIYTGDGYIKILI